MNIIEKIKNADLITIATCCAFISAIGSLASIYTFLEYKLSGTAKIHITVVVVLFVIAILISIIYFLQKIIRNEYKENIKLKKMISKIYSDTDEIKAQVHQISDTCLPDDDLIKHIKEIEFVKIEEVIQVEEAANEVWVFSSDLRIDREHEQFKKIIGENLKENYKSRNRNKNYRYIVPDTIDESLINSFKNRFKNYINDNKFDNKVEYQRDIDDFFRSLFYYIPSENIITHTMQDTVIYNPNQDKERAFVFPFQVQQPRLAYEIRNRTERSILIKDFQKNSERYKDIKLLEKNAKYIYVITDDLSLDVDSRFCQTVKDNLKNENDKKKKLAKNKKNSNKYYFDCKYKYILFVTKEKKKQLEDNINKYRNKILAGFDFIDEQDLFLKINLNFNTDIIRLFGSIFQERSIYIQSDNHQSSPTFYQIINTGNGNPNEDGRVRYIAVDQNIAYLFKNSFENVWNQSFDYGLKKLAIANEEDSQEGKKVLSNIFNVISDCLSENKDDLKNLNQIFEMAEETNQKVNQKFEIHNKETNIQLLLKVLEPISQNILKKNDFIEIIKKYHW